MASGRAALTSGARGRLRTPSALGSPACGCVPVGGGGRVLSRPLAGRGARPGPVGPLTAGVSVLSENSRPGQGEAHPAGPQGASWPLGEAWV